MTKLAANDSADEKGRCVYCDTPLADNESDACRPCELSAEGYEDGYKGRPPRSDDKWYMDGYRAGQSAKRRWM